MFDLCCAFRNQEAAIQDTGYRIQDTGYRKSVCRMNGIAI
jgi:hypothetical protein